jgi:solute carrier family 25 phosphate transporter 23/24/25/41
MWWRHLVAGGVAGAVSRTCTAPLDRLKIMLQVHGGRKSLKILDTVKYMLKEGGIRGFWRGNGMNVLKIAPESAIKFGAYDFIKRLIRGDEDRDLHLYERFLAGSLAGGVSQSVIYPMEVGNKLVRRDLANKCFAR